MTEPLFKARLVAIEYETADILSFLLRPMDPALPLAIDPGSHVDIHLPNGLMRSYSLSNCPWEGRGYRLTVARDANTRGGSAYMHDQLRVGQILEISRPRNNFEVEEQAAMSVFMAGGIGITPFVPMLARLNESGRPWRLHYCVRSRDRAALLDELKQLEREGSGEIRMNYDDTDGILNLADVIGSLDPEVHVYCCGPAPMLEAFRINTEKAGFQSRQVHFEYFNADVKSATEGGFVVVLNRSGQEIPVAPGETILQALTSNGVNVPFSCEEGICGACETRVIEGVPDHRDMILSEQERSESKTMMICCSGCKSQRLVLDI
jgi:vanillate O-demethylase ferredoxin subunit